MSLKVSCLDLHECVGNYQFKIKEDKKECTGMMSMTNVKQMQIQRSSSASGSGVGGAIMRNGGCRNKDGEVGAPSGPQHCLASQSLLSVYQQQTHRQNGKDGDGSIAFSDNQHCNTGRNEKKSM